MKVGVTGAHGFIGSHLGYEPIEGDILGIETLDGYDCVVHLAALADVDESRKIPLEYFYNNVIGTFCILDAAKNSGVKRVVFASSSSVYVPTNPYAATKVEGEKLCKQFVDEEGLEVMILRFFNVYGTGCKGVISNFLHAKKNNIKARITGNGEQRRDFIHVDDVCSAITASMKHGKAGQPYDIGTGVSTSVLELANLMDVEYGFVDPRPDDPDLSVANITDTMRELEWEPKVELADGLKRLMEEKK